MSKCIVIIGMRGSGALLLARLLNICGVEAGNSLLAAEEQDRTGYFETEDITELNELILKELNSCWYDCNPLPSNWSELERIKAYGNEVKSIIARDFNGAELFLLKDQRIAILLPLYLKVFRELNVQPYFVVAQRPPLETAKLLERRWAFPLSHSLKLYKRYRESIEKFASNQPVIEVNFQEIFNNPLEVIKKIEKEFNLKFQHSEKIEKEIAGFIKRNLNHYHHLNESDILIETAEELDQQREIIKSLDGKINFLKEKLLRIENSLTQRLKRQFNKIFKKVFPSFIVKRYFNVLRRYKKQDIALLNQNSSSVPVRSVNAAYQIKATDILFLSSKADYGREAKTLYDIAQETARYYNIKIAFLHWGPLLPHFAKQFPVVSVDKRNLANYYGESLFLRANPNLVYVNGLDNLMSIYEAPSLGMPIILHIYEPAETIKQCLKNYLLRTVIQSAAGLVVASEEAKNILVKKAGCSSYQITTAPPFVSSREILARSNLIDAKTVRQELGAGKNDIIALSIGEASVKNGLDIFMDACKIIQASGGNNRIKLVWLGKIPEEAEAIDCILNNNKSLIFAGAKDNPYPYLKAADVFVLPSLSSDLPLTLLEAMACEKPVVVFQKNKQSSAVIKNCGITVKKANAQSLAKTLLDFADEDKGKIQWRGRKAKEIQQKYYEKDIVMPQIITAIKELLK